MPGSIGAAKPIVEIPNSISMNVLQAKQAMDSFRMFSSANGKNDAIAERNFTPGVSDNGIFTITANSSVTNKAKWAFGRTDKDRLANNTVRTIFLQAVLLLCNQNDLSKIPKRIKAALEIGNYGSYKISKDGVVSNVSSGKPLTSRRICEVFAALKKEKVIDYNDTDYTGITLKKAAVKEEYVRQQKAAYSLDEVDASEDDVREVPKASVREKPKAKPAVRKKIVQINKPGEGSVFSNRLALFNKGVKGKQ